MPVSTRWATYVCSGAAPRPLRNRDPYTTAAWPLRIGFFFFKQKTAYEFGLGIPAEPLFRSVGMGDAGIKSAIQGSNVPNPDEAVPSFVSGAMAKAGKGLLEGTLQAGTSAVSDKLLDLVRLAEP